MSPSADTNGYHSPSNIRTALGRSVDDAAKLWIRFEATKSSDSVKNVLIEDLITRYENLMRENQDCLERSQGWEYQQSRIKMLESSVLRIQGILNRDPHVLILIDGNNLVFNNNLLQQGAAGGKQAAALLADDVTKWANSNVGDYPADSKVMIRVYANLRGLAEACVRAGMVDYHARVEDFARGFTCSSALVDFTDVGDGKGSARDKVQENFKLFLYNYHCRQIFLGCTRDSGYTDLLDLYKDDEEALPRVALLEGASTDNALTRFRKVKISGIFHEGKSSLLPPQYLSGQRIEYRSDLNASSDIFTPRHTPPTLQSPFGSTASLARKPMTPVLAHVRTDSLASSGTTSDTVSSTWATVTSKNKNRPLTDTLRPVSNEPLDTSVKRNRAGQRIDTPGEYDREEVQRLKKLKGCNQHYIGVGCCHYNAGRADKCPHKHSYKFSKTELKSLRVVAKETPCKRGHDCDDVNCIYGHMCPFPAATQGSMRGAGCLNGDDCRFPRSMHNMDTAPVKMIRAAGAF